MIEERPLILVTNDDSITAKGIRTLISIMSKIGDVVVVAPNSPQSAKGQAITISEPLYIKEHSSSIENTKEYSCSGTPVDCVKIAVHEILDRKPDLCVSGINHGSNAAINVIYSGTMGAAIEATIKGIPSIGFSLLDYSEDADFEPCTAFIKKITHKVLNKGLAKGVALNVNIPKLPLQEIKGIKICKQAKAQWIEKFEKRTTPMGKDYYWLTGDFVNEDTSELSDEHALEHGYVSVVPTIFDVTAHNYITELNTWNLND